MSNELIAFSSAQFGELRTTVIDGKPWVVGIDLCRMVGIKQPHAALRKLRTVEKGYHKFDTPRGEQTLVIVSEPGFWRLTITAGRDPPAVALPDSVFFP